MRGWIVPIAVLVLLMTLALGLSSGFRWYSAATVNVNIVTPAPGWKCAVASSKDGVSIACPIAPKE